MAEEKKKVEAEDVWVVGEVATQTQPVFINTKEKDETKQQSGMYELLAKMANDIETIKNALLR